MRNGYGILGNFNPEIENKVKQIKEEIEKEKKSENPNKERIQKLAQDIQEPTDNLEFNKNKVI